MTFEPTTAQFDDGLAIHGDSSDARILSLARSYAGDAFPLVIADPPYGNVLPRSRAAWDRTTATQRVHASQTLGTLRLLQRYLAPGAALYLWGGYGTLGFRPFFEVASRVEHETALRVANVITWSKRRAYGVPRNYLSTREELLYLVNGDPKRPRKFTIPLLEAKRAYAGFNAKYPAKSEHYRRTNVWTDVTELFAGKVHEAQKPIRLYEIPIEVHTEPGECVLDPYAGSMTLAYAARRLGRRWVCIESDRAIFDAAVAEMRGEAPRKR